MGAKTLVSCEEFERLAERLGPCELVDGEVIPLSPAGYRHNLVTVRIFRALDRFVLKKKLGRVLTNETGLHVRKDPARSRGADIAYLSYKRLPKGREPKGFLTVPPELIVEVLDSGMSWERIMEKVDDYHTFGVDMVWVADSRTRSFHLFPRNGKHSVLKAQETLHGGVILPGFSARVGPFFDPE